VVGRLSEESIGVVSSPHLFRRPRAHSAQYAEFRGPGIVRIVRFLRTRSWFRVAARTDLREGQPGSVEHPRETVVAAGTRRLVGISAYCADCARGVGARDPWAGPWPGPGSAGSLSFYPRVTPSVGAGWGGLVVAMGEEPGPGGRQRPLSRPRSTARRPRAQYAQYAEIECPRISAFCAISADRVVAPEGDPLGLSWRCESTR
jgi:hypothetical protein